MLARERMEDARVGGGGSRDEGHGPGGGGSRARALQRSPEEGEKHGRREGGCWLRGPANQRARERRARAESGSGARGERTRGMLGRFRRDRVHAEWSTVVCVRPRSSEDAPGCSRNGWTTLAATAASRHRGTSRCRRVDRFRESRDKREKHWCR